MDKESALISPNNYSIHTFSEDSTRVGQESGYRMEGTVTTQPSCLPLPCPTPGIEIYANNGHSPLQTEMAEQASGPAKESGICRINDLDMLFSWLISLSNAILKRAWALVKNAK